MAACLICCAGFLHANFGGERHFAGWIVAVAASFALYLRARIRTL
jgi:hypothetical protein